LRTRRSLRPALDNRCSQMRFLLSPLPPFHRSQSESEQLGFHLVRFGRSARRFRTCGEVGFRWRIPTDIVWENWNEPFGADRRASAAPSSSWFNRQWAFKPGTYSESKPVPGGCRQETGTILEEIVGDLLVSRRRLRQTDANELSCRRQAAAQPGLELSSNRFDTRPIIVESAAEVLDRFSTQPADRVMVERPQAIDPMGSK
jgi:hypothetical protein